MEASASSEERTWAMICHLVALAGYVIPFGNVIGPLVVWMIKRETMPLVDDQGREALNFQLSLTIYLVVSAVLTIVGIGILGIVGFALFGLVVIIIGAVKANTGEQYRYPLCIRFIK